MVSMSRVLGRRAPFLSRTALQSCSLRKANSTFLTAHSSWSIRQVCARISPWADSPA